MTSSERDDVDLAAEVRGGVAATGHARGMSDPEEGPRFRTSREAYDWIRRDPAFDPAELVVLYYDHEENLAEVGLVAFDPEGEIPWQRVRALGWKGQLVWNRDARVDRLAEIRDTDR